MAKVPQTQAEKDANIEKLVQTGQLSQAQMAALLDQHSKGGYADGAADRFGLENLGDWMTIQGGYLGNAHDGTLGTGESTLTPGGAPGGGKYNPQNPWQGGVGDDGQYVPGQEGDPFRPGYGGNQPAAPPTDWVSGGGGRPGGGLGEGPLPPGMDQGGISYAPGPDAEWGMREGPQTTNRDFYAQQFDAMNTQNQNMQNNSLAAAIRRQQAAQNAPASEEFNFEYKPVTTAGADQYSLKDPFTAGETTNREMVQWYVDNVDSSTADFFREGYLSNPDKGSDSTYWSGKTDPNQLTSKLGDLSPENLGHYRTMINSFFNTQPGYSGSAGRVPEGYASPI